MLVRLLIILLDYGVIYLSYDIYLRLLVVLPFSLFMLSVKFDLQPRVLPLVVSPNFVSFKSVRVGSSEFNFKTMSMSSRWLYVLGLCFNNYHLIMS